MLYLLKKTVRDLWNYKVQFIAVLLMVFISVLVYTGIEGLWLGMQNSATDWLDKSNTAQAWISGSFEQSEVRKIRNLDDIENTQGTAYLTTSLQSPDNKGQLLLMSSSSNEISIPTTTKGEKYTTDIDGIWINEDFAIEHKMKIDDMITIQFGDSLFQLKVKGFVLSPEYLSYTGSVASLLPDHFQYGYGYIPMNTMEDILGYKPIYNQIKITFKDKSLSEDKQQQLRSDIENDLGSVYAGYQNRNDFQGISNYMDAAKQYESFSLLFSCVFIFLALLTIQTTMKRLIENQRVQIGTLKAIGYSSRQIRFHYSFYGLLVSVVGGVTGLLVAPYTITNVLLTEEKKFYTVAGWNGENSLMSVVLLVFIILCCTVTSLLACKKSSDGMPAQTMRDETPRNRKPIFMEHFSGLWKSLSYEWKWAIRETAKNKGRTVIGIIGVLGSVMLLLAGFGMYDSLSNSCRQLYTTQFDYGSKIVLNTSATSEDRSELWEKTNENGQWVQENTIEFRTSSTQANSTVQIYGEGYFAHFNNTSGTRVSWPDDGIMVSQQFADNHSLQVGDTVQFRVNGEANYITGTVKEIITPYTPQGIYLSESVWKSLGQEFSPNTLLAKASSNVDDIADYDYVTEIMTREKQLNSAYDVLDGFILIVILLLGAAILLSIVILYNLGLLSFTEKSREYATQKVLGFHDREIRKVIHKENIIQVLLGLIIGIPCGFWFLEFYMSAISTNSFQYRSYISPLSFCLSLLLVIGCSQFTEYIVSRKIKRLNMVEALKSVE